MESPPIFIVGVQRSGTTLLSAMLAAHSRMSCGPETHFFQRLAFENIENLVNPVHWPKNALDFIKSITFTNFTANTSQRISILEKYHLSEQQIYEYLKDQQPGVPAILNSIVLSYMHSLKKARWVEKTPDHIKHLGLVREYFPDSPIIRIIRDPRDVALSLMNVPWGAKTFFEAIDYWKRMDELSNEFFTKDQCSYTLRFEDLVAETEFELKKLCEFLGENFEKSMLNTSTTGKQVNSQDVPWKKKVEQPVDKNRAYSWKNHLSDEMIRYTEGIIGIHLLRYGYPLTGNFPYLGEYFPKQIHFHFYSKKVSLIAENGIRFWKKETEEKPVATIFFGEPMKSKYFGTNILDRIKTIAYILKILIQTIVKKRTLYWLISEENQKFNGIGNKFLSLLLKPFQL